MTYVGIIFATDVGKQLINKALKHVLTSEALIFWEDRRHIY